MARGQMVCASVKNRDRIRGGSNLAASTMLANCSSLSRYYQLLEHHRRQGLPAADLQVIRRGKALEYFSRHYGQVYVNDERQITVKEALVGINQLIDEETGGGKSTRPPMPNH